MDTKPYRLQSPEDIAKDYGGNKQKIAQAMQMGVVDPTAGVLAGMFIDRMRAAQMQEQAPQATVAQQVMGGAPAQAPLAQAGGLGATAPASPPMAPQGGAPMAPPPMEAAPPMQAPPPGMAAGGVFEAPYMAGGGLSELPLPDTMFDEDRNGGYAGGGIVAFAGGDEVVAPGAYGQIIEDTALDFLPGLQITSRKRDPAKNAQVGGVAGSYHLTGDARDFVPPEGMGMNELAKSLKAKFGGNFDVINEGDHVHVEPGPKAGARTTLPERDVNTAKGFGLSFGDIEEMINRRYAPSAEEQEAMDALRARAKEMASPEYYEKERKDSMWETLATIGFNMASSKSPYLLQAVGEAAAAALPGARADKKERKALKDKALNLMVELGAKDRRDAMEKFKMTQSVFETQLAQQQFGEKMALSKEELNLARRRLNAEIEAAKNRGADPNDILFAMFMQGGDQRKLAEEFFAARYGQNKESDPEQRLKNLREGRDGGQTTVVDFRSLQQPK